MWLNVVVVLASGWLPAGSCCSVWAWCSWGLSSLLLFWVGSFPPLCSFFFSGDVPKNDHFQLATAGVTFLLPGRDVGSKQGHRPQNRYFQVSLTCNGLARVHLGLSQRHCAVSLFRQDLTLQQNQYDDEFFNLGGECEHAFLIARSVEANHHNHRGPVSRFHRSRFRGAAEANLPEVLLLAFIDGIPHLSRSHRVAEASLLSSRLAERSFHCICPSRTSTFVDNDTWQCETALWAHWVHVGRAEAMSEVHLANTDTSQTVGVSVPHGGGPDGLWARVPVDRNSGLPVVLQRYASTFHGGHVPPSTNFQSCCRGRLA